MASFFNRRQSETEAGQPGDEPGLPQPGFDTVLGAGCQMEGTVTSSGNVRMDGVFTGDLNITGNVLVGETAKIDADIHARNISIAGTVRGNVSGKKVQILRTGRIWGDISATALSTEEGAFIDGRITMMRHDAAQGLEAGEENPEPVQLVPPVDEQPEETEPADSAEADDSADSDEESTEPAEDQPEQAEDDD